MKYPEFFTRNDRKVESQEGLQAKVEAILQAMTPEEKLSFCHGGANPEGVGQIANAGYMAGIPRLGVPEGRMYDGPAGVTSIYDTTGLPIQQLLASCWSEQAAYDYGAVMGSENVSVSGNYQLGAQYDVTRIPHFGRSRDMLGEDPALTSSLAVAETKGIQEQGAIATLKHYAGYAQSASPVTSADFHIDEQTLHEAYLRPFEAAAAKGGAGSVMCTYNKINGKWAASNPYLQKTVLRDMWGFRGSMMSDWGATHRLCTHLGMDIEMPNGMYNSDERILRAINQGKMSWNDVDDACRHVLWGLASCGYLSLVTLNEAGQVQEEHGRTEPIRLPYTYAEDRKNGLLDRNAETCYEIAVKGITLLKNQGKMLPLEKTDTVGVIGLGGSHLISGYDQERSFGRLERMESPAEALKKQLGDVRTAVGLDIVGEAIPAEYLYQDEACSAHGLLRTYGILEEDGACPSNFGPGGAGQEFKGGAVFAEDDDCEEETFSFGPPVGSNNAAADMPGHVTGEKAGVDAKIEFTCGTVCGGINQTYQNAADGTAFRQGAAYTWKGYLKAPETGTYTLSLQAIGGQTAFRIAVDGENYEFVGNTNTREGSHWAWGNVVPTPEGMDIQGKEFELEAGKVYPISLYARATLPHKDLQLRAAWITPSQKKKNLDDAVMLAAQCPKTLIFVHSQKEAESNMMQLPVTVTSLELPADQLALLRAAITAAKTAGNQVCVCVYGGIPVTMGSWIADTDAVMQLWLPGQEGGRAIADLLTGKRNPSGKLAQSLPAFDGDTLVTDTKEHQITRHDGYGDDKNRLVVEFSEGIFFGYRWYDQTGKKPLYPFGYGLSYTEFSYQDLQVEQQGERITVALTVTNTGSRIGDEIVQVYLGAGQVPEYAQVAKKQLVAYQRVEDIQPQESRRITLELDPRCLMYWDIHAPISESTWGTKGKWLPVQGKRQVLVGNGSTQLLLAGEIEVK